MADDLGDSNPSSLRQGGALPANSTAYRTVGRIQPAAGTTLTVDGFSTLSGSHWQLSILNPSLTELTNVSGPQNLSLSLFITNTGFYTLRVRNMESTNTTQKVWVKANYFGPRSLHIPAPTILQQPTNIFTAAGATVRFYLEVAQSYGGYPDVEWFKDGVFTLIEGVALNSGMRFTQLDNVTTNDSGSTIIARVYNDTRAIESNPVTLTVYPDATPQITDIGINSEGVFVFTVAGPIGLRYRLESSTDLQTWQEVDTQAAPFTPGALTTSEHRFYRLIPILTK